MGSTHVTLKLRKEAESRQSVDLNFLVDSGAEYSLVPRPFLAALGIKPYRSVDIMLADGTVLTRDVGSVFYEYQGLTGVAPAVFGEEGEEPLLGSITLESLRLILNPLRRELYPARAVRL